MVRRIGMPFVCVALAAAAACHGDNSAGPPAPTCHSATASQINLAVAGYMSLDPAADAGCVTIAANASTIDSAEYLLVPQSAAGTFGDSSPFQLGAATLAPTAMRGAVASAPLTGPGAVAVQFDGLLRGIGRAHAASAAAAARLARGAAAAAAAPPVAAPPAFGSLRTFAVCDTIGAACKFKKVGARVRAVGAHVAIYVDTLAPTNGLDSAGIDSLKQVFDTLLYPLDSATFGPVTDLDANGVVIALMTPVVNSLVTKTMCTNSGFVAGFFYPGDLDVSASTDSSNHGEIFYSIVADPGGTFSCAHTSADVQSLMPVTFVHELQHMINFAQHVLFRPGAASEEGWLDEGLSKYAEELAGRKYLQVGDNTNFSRYAFGDVDDAYKYLSATGDSPLLIELDQGTLAEVGASWLFMRYLVDQFGDTLPRKLVQTTLVGSGNVQTQTGASFTTTVTRWALANWVSDLPGFTTPPELSYPSWHFRTRTFASLNQQDPTDFPRPYPLVPVTSAGVAVNLSGTLRSGSGVYLRALQGPAAPAFTLLFSRDGSGALPAAVVPRLTIIRIR